MNRNFISYATSMAFSIQLTKAMIRALIEISAPRNSRSQLQWIAGKSYESLIRRGLIEHAEQRKLILTKPGKLVVELLKEANLIEYDRRQLITTKFAEDIHREFVQ